jgi:oligoendopeptidase F
MLTSVDVTNLATKDDIRQLMDRMDHRFEMVDLKFAALDDKLSERIQGLDDKLSERIQGLDERVTERITTLDLKFAERVAALDEKFSERIEALDDKFTERFEGTVHRIEAMVFRSINRHLTFSVMAMAAVSGMFTWLAR